MLSKRIKVSRSNELSVHGSEVNPGVAEATLTSIRRGSRICGKGGGGAPRAPQARSLARGSGKLN